MGVEIKFSQTYFWLNSWVLANIIQLATQSFCDRFVDYRIDPGRRLYDQMTLAARCGVANIAEGTARHSTSIETEMRLLDVARASIDELQGDFFNFLLRRNQLPWPIGNPDREAIWNINLDAPRYSNNLLHEAARHILQQKSKYDRWIENQSAEIVANTMLVLCVRINKMIESLIQERLELFKTQGGFTENMTSTRLEARRSHAAAQNHPECPLCGKPMIKRLQKKGTMQGREFWGCSDYPRCTGIRPAE
ncbi:MAG: four helix bundle suffix domain-containing protein [Bacteroidales bacterium]|nr:four helix bundle suffix domain-containing protein [Bacteroidales bacterium]